MIITKTKPYGGILVRTYINIEKDAESYVHNVEVYDGDTGVLLDMDRFAPKIQIMIYDISDVMHSEYLLLGA